MERERRHPGNDRVRLWVAWHRACKALASPKKTSKNANTRLRGDVSFAEEDSHRMVYHPPGKDVWGTRITCQWLIRVQNSRISPFYGNSSSGRTCLKRYTIAGHEAAKGTKQFHWGFQSGSKDHIQTQVFPSTLYTRRSLPTR